jgi:general secretion pathway protein A
MYESFYGLKEKPFNLTPDPDYLYMSPGHENAYTHLEYAIQESKGFVVVTGEVGSGKTTLINYLLRKIPQAIHVGIINNTFVQPQELLKMICNEFEIQFEDSDKTVLLTRLYGYLLEQFSKRERVVLIIDEAQNLSEKTLEEIRMLSNLESEKDHLIQMILVGQPQLKEKLQRKSMEQFVQRVNVYCHLDALDKVDVENYIRHRLTVAGAQNLDLFDPEAIKAIYKHSLGIPRLINTLCDAAFVYGYADDVKVIGRDLIEAVAKARNLGVKGNGLDASLPEDQEKGGGVIPEPQMWLVKELEGRIRALELQLASQGENVQRVGKGLEALNGHRDERDKIIIKLFGMVKKSMERRVSLMAQIARLKSAKPVKKTQQPARKAKPSIPDVKTPEND